MKELEIFKNPTVKEVIFKITFPSFFSIEGKIGEFQLGIMDRFPKSKLLYSHSFIIGQGPGSQIDKEESFSPTKIWQFMTEAEDIVLNITNESLDISSKQHKTYNNSHSKSEERFRDTVSNVVDGFLDLVKVNVINRIGLRYVDNCPLPETLSVPTFLEYYNSSVNLKNLEIEKFDTVNRWYTEIDTINENGVYLKFKEILTKAETWIYNLDFDGAMLKIPAAEYLKCLDLIHLQTSKQYLAHINSPVIEIMNK